MYNTDLYALITRILTEPIKSSRLSPKLLHDLIQYIFYVINYISLYNISRIINEALFQFQYVYCYKVCIYGQYKGIVCIRKYMSQGTLMLAGHKSITGA